MISEICKHDKTATEEEFGSYSVHILSEFVIILHTQVSHLLVYIKKKCLTDEMLLKFILFCMFASLCTFVCIE